VDSAASDGAYGPLVDSLSAAPLRGDACPPPAHRPLGQPTALRASTGLTTAACTTRALRALLGLPTLPTGSTTVMCVLALGPSHELRAVGYRSCRRYEITDKQPQDTQPRYSATLRVSTHPQIPHQASRPTRGSVGSRTRARGARRVGNAERIPREVRQARVRLTTRASWRAPPAA
jgi:hypothetical protein